MIKAILVKLYDWACVQNNSNIFSLLDEDKNAMFCDLGCDDGYFTKRMAEIIKSNRLYGIEIVKKRADLARKKGIKVTQHDLNKQCPYKDNYFDVICANQIIEHLYETDIFLKEIKRILKQGGYAIVSTENLASWHNILSLVLGWQPFSLTNISSIGLGIGNPLAIFRGEPEKSKSLQHIKVFSFKGLEDLFIKYGFKIEKSLGAGYYPLPGIFARLDKKHAAFITFKIRKVNK